MLHFTKKEYGTEEYCIQFEEHEDMDAIMNTREIRDGGIGGRAIEALLEGGKNGVDVGLAIIPGVITICTLVMMLTNGASADGTYTGAAYEGIAFLPWLGKKLNSSYHRFLDSQMHPESPFRSRHSVLPVPQSDWYRTWQKPEPSSPMT